MAGIVKHNVSISEFEIESLNLFLKTKRQDLTPEEYNKFICTLYDLIARFLVESMALGAMPGVFKYYEDFRKDKK